ncbi:divalent-cation tolerance protein CutA [Rhizosaccharibacter radicis]|uniref:Divalent-cation tolerance protein CutA n=1 Tax=Rhizosaccharibacter radicis TaxID=2782605 RepID=A0ABT1VXB0_9PROT|nr:divalent-cation tolerance protein CutA [Acetobacteraceae bacterium KSS12]
MTRSDIETSAAVLVTTATADEHAAEQIAAALLDRRLAACVQILPVRSRYRWKNVVETAEEWRLEIKTMRDRVPAIATLLDRLHPYELPELLVLPVLDGSAAFLAWIDENASG